jgi:hypothetical protein
LTMPDGSMTDVVLSTGLPTVYPGDKVSTQFTAVGSSTPATGVAVEAHFS